MRLAPFLDRNARWVFPLPSLLFIAAMMIFPILYTIRNSLTNWSLGKGVPASYIGLANYQALASDDRFHQAILRTFYFTALAVAIEVVLGVAIALLLSRNIRGKNLITAVFLLPMMATPVAIAMVWLLMYEPTVGVINWALRAFHLPTGLWIAGPGSVIPSLALVDAWEWTPMIALITLAGMAGVPDEPMEAARVDGAGPWQTFWRVTLPLLMPTIIVATILRSIDALKTFDIIYTMTGGGPGYSSETLNINVYVQAFSYFNFGYASSMLVVFFAIVLGVTLMLNHARRVLQV